MDEQEKLLEDATSAVKMQSFQVRWKKGIVGHGSHSLDVVSSLFSCR